MDEKPRQILSDLIREYGTLFYKDRTRLSGLLRDKSMLKTADDQIKIDEVFELSFRTPSAIPSLNSKLLEVFGVIPHCWSAGISAGIKKKAGRDAGAQFPNQSELLADKLIAHRKSNNSNTIDTNKLVIKPCNNYSVSNVIRLLCLCF